MPAKPNVQVYLDKEEDATIARIAERSDRTRSYVGKQLLRAGLEVTGDSLTQPVKVLGIVGLGDNCDVQATDAMWATPPSNVRVPTRDCYVLVGLGVSMTTEGPRSIPSGSHILFCPCVAPATGDVVHAQFIGDDGAEKATVKRFCGFHPDTGLFELQPFNSSSKPIYVRKGELEVRGKFVASWLMDG